MTTYAAVEQFALKLPETTVSPSYNGSTALRVNKALLARLRVEMADEPDPLTGSSYGEVLMLRVADLGVKEALLADDPTVFLTTPHYDGYAGVLVRLARVEDPEMRELVTEAWMAVAPKRALKAYEERIGPLPGRPS